MTSSRDRKVAIVWFRRDLRLADNQALRMALIRGGPVVPFFVLEPDEEATATPGVPSRAWIRRSLRSLEESLRGRGSRLVIRLGPAGKALSDLANETGAGAVFWNRLYEPPVAIRDAERLSALRSEGLEAVSCDGTLLHDPTTIRTSQGGPFRVFTPFWRHCLSLSGPEPPIRAPSRIPGPSGWPESSGSAVLGPESEAERAVDIDSTWKPGEAGAAKRLAHFLESGLPGYPANRDRPDLQGTSRLSPHLHFGEISPRQVWHAALARAAVDPTPGAARGAEAFLRQIGWREFAHHLLVHFPGTPDAPLRLEFRDFRWRKDRDALSAWSQGRTGYPIVDAGMRELQRTGWMHNRVRMVVASFLVKDLLLPWQEGSRWFLETLTDADLANNTFGWQWTAGCGADAAPFFRIFNPVIQGRKFDPEGTYVRRWVPELERLPSRWIHRPWDAPAEALRTAGVRIGKTYPAPIVDHASARIRALAAFTALKPPRPKP